MWEVKAINSQLHWNTMPPGFNILVIAINSAQVFPARYITESEFTAGPSEVKPSYSAVNWISWYNSWNIHASMCLWDRKQGYPNLYQTGQEAFFRRLNDLSTINVVFEGPIASTVQLIIVDSQELLPYPVKTRISKKPAFMFKLHISWKCNTVGLLVSAWLWCWMYISVPVGLE